MSDASLRAAERAWVASPDDAELERAYLTAWERAGCPGRDPRRDPIPGDVVESHGLFGGGRYKLRRWTVIDPPAANDPLLAAPGNVARARIMVGFDPATKRSKRLIRRARVNAKGEELVEVVRLQGWMAWAKEGRIVRRMVGPRG